MNPQGGGSGGYTTGVINGLQGSDTLYIYVGQGGINGDSGSTPKAGGWPNGGGGQNHGASGGGRSQISINRIDHTEASHPNILLIAAGGGGGTITGTSGTDASCGKAGGGLNGNSYSDSGIDYSLGGTQTQTPSNSYVVVGTFLQGGTANGNYEGGGGDGYYGGSCGHTIWATKSGGGGGGSSYIAGYTVSNKLDSRVYLENTDTQSGNNGTTSGGEPYAFTSALNNSTYGKGADRIFNAYSSSLRGQNGFIAIQYKRFVNYNDFTFAEVTPYNYVLVSQDDTPDRQRSTSQEVPLFTYMTSQTALTISFDLK
eukprot:768747-Hanusia_phi.AAC.3